MFTCCTVVKTFLSERADEKTPLVLGLSGGVDSLALFLALLEVHSGPLHVVHIDHGWRPSSAEQAGRLRAEYVGSRAIWHGYSLSPPPLRANAENWARDERLMLFLEVCREVGAPAVLLAHHADDQAETVLKRICDGASLARCAGLRPVCGMRSGLVIWRPLLPLNKGQLAASVAAHGLEPLEDSSNSDPRILRGRMRTHIFPQIEQSLGRSVRANLAGLGSQVRELEEFLQHQAAVYLSRRVEGPLGFYLALPDVPHPFLLKYLVRSFCVDVGLSLSRSQVATACHLLQSGAANRAIGEKLFVDRRRLFFLKPAVEWQLRASSEVRPALSGWQQAWRGQLQVSLPVGSYRLGSPQRKARYRGSCSLDRWWTHHKVPAFLRERVPVLWSGDQIVHEFLTGKILPRNDLDMAVKVSMAFGSGQLGHREV